MTTALGNLDRLGRPLVVSRRPGAAGPWFDVTWPDVPGVATALAPDRFSGALNQALGVDAGLGGWVRALWRYRREGRVSPIVLLRRAFDECASFAEAVRLLSETPLTRPALYTLAGADPTRGVVIERLANAALVHDAPVCVADPFTAAAPGRNPRARRAETPHDMLRGSMAAVADGRAWLQATPLGDVIRLAVTANAVTGELTVQGIADGAATTSVLRLVA